MFLQSSDLRLHFCDLHAARSHGGEVPDCVQSVNTPAYLSPLIHTPAKICVKYRLVVLRWRNLQDVISVIWYMLSGIHFLEENSEVIH